MTSGMVLAIAGSKGGVGKTTTSINLGSAASEGDRSVLVVEMDLAMANIPDFLKLTMDSETDPTLHDVLAGETEIEDAIYTAPDGLHVLPCGTTLEGYMHADTSRLVAVVSALREEYDLILLDTPSGMGRETLLAIALSDGVILVSTPRVSAIRDTQKTKGVIERIGGRTIGLILTHTGSGVAPPGQTLAEFLGVELLGAVPEDEAVTKSQDAGVSAVVEQPESQAAMAYRQIIKHIDSGSTESDRRSVQSLYQVDS